MKKIINGKLYNTETAKVLGYWDNDLSIRDFNFCSEKLFLKKTGEYFLFGNGGANSKYSRSCGQNEWCGDSKIIPLTESEARDWSETHLNADEYIEIWGEPEE